jgi:hypothetical protein
MRRAPHVAILTLLLATAPILPGSTARAADGKPVAAVTEPILDAGEVPVGEPIDVVFEIENQGDAPLQITEVRPTCGCTVAEYHESIEPGETGAIHATIDTTSIVGPNAKSITVFTNDPDNPRIQLTVQSDVKPFLTVNPGYARFTTFVREDQDQTQSQLLWAPDFEGLEITGVESPTDFVAVSYREARDAERAPDAAGKQWRIDVTLSKSAPVGPVADHVVVRTNHPKQAVVEIPVSGFVRPVVAVTPPAIDFGQVDPAESQEWGILVRNFGSAPLRIEDVESPVQGLDVKVESLRDGEQYRLVFTPTASMPKGPFEGTAEVRTNLPQQPSLSVDLRGEIR